MQGARIGADAAQLPISRQARSYPETLVLYRMRPTVSAQVSREVGRGASDTAV